MQVLNYTRIIGSSSNVFVGAVGNCPYLNGQIWCHFEPNHLLLLIKLEVNNLDLIRIILMIVTTQWSLNHDKKARLLTTLLDK